MVPDDAWFRWHGEKALMSLTAGHSIGLDTVKEMSRSR